MLEFYGKKVFQNANLVQRIQFKFPRSKSKRIRKKWAKNTSNFKWVPDNNVYMTEDFIIMHPEVLRALEKELKQ